MIELYSGTPGSSKSLHAAGDIRDALNKRRGVDKPVIANFNVITDGVRRPQAFHYVPNGELTPKLLTDFADEFWSSVDRPFSEDYLLLVLDECQLVWNSRTWQDKGRNRGDSRLDWLEFFSQHRKYGYRIILIAQSAKMIDNQFRMLVENEVNHRKVSHMGVIGGIVGGLFGGKLFMRVRYLFQTHERLGMQLALMNRKDAAMYDSYARLRKLEPVTKG